MGFFSKLFRRNGGEEKQKVGGMEDFMTLIRVYFQAALASDLGITNLGVGERSRCKKMLKEMYDMPDDFFKEVDGSIKKRCHKLQDAQTYLIQFQGFTQDLMMLVGNLMKYKLRLPGFMKKMMYTMTEKTVNDIFTKNDYDDPGVMKTVVAIRQYAQKLGFSQQWITTFVYKVVMLAKKEPKKQEE